MSTEPIRLNKFISESGICSRREADRFIEQGNVFINGRKAKIGDKVLPGDQVRVNGNMLEPREEEDEIFIAFNKPVGVTSTTEASVAGNIVDYVNHSSRIFPIGRLDKDSQGLIFLTNNGDIVNKILRASNNHEKEYLVTVDQPITPSFIENMKKGVPILGGTTKKCQVIQESPFVFRIILIQGLNRQIRRMCEYFNYQVTKLERIRIMNVSLKGLPPGEWRDLTFEELKGIYKLIEHSSSEDKRAEKRKNEPGLSGKPASNKPVKQLTYASYRGKTDTNSKSSKTYRDKKDKSEKRSGPKAKSTFKKSNKPSSGSGRRR